MNVRQSALQYAGALYTRVAPSCVVLPNDFSAIHGRTGVGREEGEREVLLLECNSNIRVQDSTACIHKLASCVPYPFPRLHLGRLGHVGEMIRVFWEEDL
jgi:hypothetical protein